MFLRADISAAGTVVDGSYCGTVWLGKGLLATRLGLNGAVWLILLARALKWKIIGARDPFWSQSLRIYQLTLREVCRLLLQSIGLVFWRPAFLFLPDIRCLPWDLTAMEPISALVLQMALKLISVFSFVSLPVLSSCFSEPGFPPGLPGQVRWSPPCSPLGAHVAASSCAVLSIHILTSRNESVPFLLPPTLVLVITVALFVLLPLRWTFFYL